MKYYLIGFLWILSLIITWNVYYQVEQKLIKSEKEISNKANVKTKGLKEKKSLFGKIGKL